jgi:ADP-ribose pyrophosphatase YjhB (NUDIX family)
VEDDRRYPKRPILGVGALIFRGDSFLMGQRGKQPLMGWWSLPGGAVETGERLVEAMRREVREETGLEIEPVRVIEIFERLMPDGEGKPEYHYVLIDYLCEIRGGTEQAGDDVCALAWVKESDLGSYQITEGTVGVIRKGFREREN